MLNLIAASIIWAFSFGLIKHKLAVVGMDPLFIAFARLALSALAFLPFVPFARIPRRLLHQCLLLGAIQYGMMYAAYQFSFQFLAAHEVALFTISTPVFVALIDDVFCRRFRPRFLLTAVLAVCGAGVVVTGHADTAARLTGVLLVQVANACFAFGQVAYRRIMAEENARAGATSLTDLDVFGLLFLGGMLFAEAPALLRVDPEMLLLGPAQIWTLLYLGLVPAGVCFFLWNAGARRTNTGMLAVMNNAKVPLGILASILCFGESANLTRLSIGAAILVVAVLLNRSPAATPG